MRSKIIFSLLYVLGVCILMSPCSAQALSSQQHIYNTSNQLDSVNESSGKHVKFVYDKNGNVVRRIVDQNLFRNGDFEAVGNGEIASGWKYWKSEGAVGTYGVIQNPVSSGQYAQKIDAQKISGGGGMNIYQDIQVEPTQKYTVSGKMTIERMFHASVWVAVHYFDAGYRLVGSENAFTYGYPANWFTFTSEIKPPQGAAIARIHFHIQELAENGYGTVYVDALKIKQGSATDLFYNSAFEAINQNDKLAAGWEAWQSEGSVGTISPVNKGPKLGQYSQLINAQKMPSGAMNFYQNIPILPGKSYELSADVKIAKLSNAAFLYALHYFDQHYKLIGSDTPASVNKPMDWTQLQGQFIPPPEAAFVRVHFHLMEQGGNGSGEVYVANTRLKRMN